MSGKYLRRFRKLLLSAAMAQKRLERSTRLLNDLKNHINQTPIFLDEKNFTFGLFFNKQNALVLAFRKNVSEHRRVSTTRHSTVINHDAWHRTMKRGGKNWWLNLVRGSRRSLRNQIMSSNRMGYQHIRQKLCRTGWRSKCSFDSKTFDPSKSSDLKPLTSACGRALRKGLARQATATRKSTRFL